MNRFPTITIALALCLYGCATALAQSKPTFEAISIKPVSPPTPQEIVAGSGRPIFNIDASHLEIRNYSLLFILSRAFQVDFRQINGPDFVDHTYFDIQATLPAGAIRDQVPGMLQAMFAERFKLTFHRETHDYVMTIVTVGKSGMKLTRLPDDTKPSPPRRNRLDDGTTITTITGPLSSLFPVMTSFGGAQIADETGLDGLYAWVLNERPASPGESFQELTFEAYRNAIESAGLKIEERKVPKDTIVVDHLEKTPTEN